MYNLIARKIMAQRLCAYQFARMLSASDNIPQLMEKFKPLITDRLVHETGVSAVLKLTDSAWTLDLRDEGTIKEGADESADITLDMKNEVFFKLIDGRTSTAAAYMSGQLKLEGNIMQAMKLSSMFKNMQSAISEEAK